MLPPALAITHTHTQNNVLLSLIQYQTTVPGTKRNKPTKVTETISKFIGLTI